MAFSRLRTATTLIGGIIAGILIDCILYPEATNSNNSPASLEDFLQMKKQYAGNENYELRIGLHDTVASELKRKDRILCMIMTSPQDLYTTAVHVSATWGQHCDKVLFMSAPQGNSKFPTIDLNIPDDSPFAWVKTKAAFQYVYDHHLDEADWFFKAYDNTYAIVENLRYLLKDYNTKYPLYLGRWLRSAEESISYMHGGAGYVLSREGLKRLVTVGFPNQNVCPEIWGDNEDINMGLCARNCGLEFVDTRDRMGCHRFHIQPPWLYLIDKAREENESECSSEFSISFYSITAPILYSMEFVIYHLKAFGSELYLETK